MSYLLRLFENESESVTIPNPLTFSGNVAFTGALNLAGATVTGMTLTGSVVAPDADDGAALGSTSLKWSDLFLASGAVINFNSGDVTITHSANALAFAGASSGYSFDAIVFPATSDGAALGSGTKMFSDLFLASGAVINFSNGDVTITHGTNSLAFAGASSGYTFDAVVTPAASDGAALGSTTVMWSDLFLASAAVINFNNGNALLTHSAGLLTFSASNVAFGVDATGIDVTFYGATTLYKAWWDQNGDTNGAWYFGADTKGVLVNAYGATTGCGVFWDPDGDTNGTLSVGASGGSKGNDFLAYGATNGNYMHWDQSANSLLLVGTASILNIAGTTASTSSTTGALICAGGMGIAGKAFLGETVVVTDAKAVIQGMNSFPKVTVTSLTSAATVALSAAQVIGGFIIDAVSEANAATLPAPADIVAAIPNCKVGTSFLLTYKNAASGAYTITVTANGASTIVGTATIEQNNTKVFQAVITNITSAAEAVVFYSVGTLVH